MRARRNFVPLPARVPVGVPVPGRVSRRLLRIADIFTPAEIEDRFLANIGSTTIR